MVKPDEIAAAIVDLAKARGADKTICPSEVARHLGGQDEAVWRPLMDPIRKQAIKLEGDGVIVIKKAGARVSPATLSGIYRIAIAESDD